MSRQCDARIQIATSRSLELDPEFAASMFYCVRDPLHEGPHWITMPSKSESPAPPPCEGDLAFTFDKGRLNTEGCSACLEHQVDWRAAQKRLLKIGYSKYRIEEGCPEPCGLELELHHDSLSAYHALIAAKDAEIAELRAFHDKILGAWDYSQAGGKGSNNPFIRKRKLYRLVRETIEQEAALAPKEGT